MPGRDAIREQVSQHEDGIRFGVFETLLKICSRGWDRRSGDQTPAASL